MAHNDNDDFPVLHEQRESSTDESQCNAATASGRPKGHTMAEEEAAAQRENLMPPSPPAYTGAEPKPDAQLHSVLLHHSGYTIFLTLCYMGLALFAWVATCILTYKPIGARHYGVVVLNSDNDGWGWTSADRYHAMYVSSERWYKASRVIQSIVAVLTIPVTSAVCAAGAVAFLQYGKHSRGLTMRQTMVMADKSWSDVGFVTRLVFGQWKRYGSSFLAYAILLNILGGILSPLQEIFLSTTIIKTPTFPQEIPSLGDFSDHFDDLGDGLTDDGLTTTLTRGRMASTGNTDPQMRLWSREIDCDTLTNGESSMECVLGGGQYTFGNMSWLNDPFFAQLPSGFSTGLVRQFAPRINSTAKRENITADDFPRNCDQITDALYIRYANVTDSETTRPSSWSIEVCMPGNMSASPWKDSRQRQDFSEEMYLNISLSGYEELQIIDGVYYSKITVNTTAGYFELPNYMNGQVAGPLLQDDPNNYCGLDCEPQGFGSSQIYDHNITSRALSNTTEATGSNATLAFSSVVNKGPLLTTTLALFGMGSFIDTLPSSGTYAAFLNDEYPDTNDYSLNSTDVNLSEQCLYLVPFVPLVRDWLDQTSVGSSLDPCVTYYDAQDNAVALVTDYLWQFVYNQWDGYGGERIQNAFTSSAFLANEAWFTDNSFGNEFSVTYDLGADTEIPVISLAGMVLISALLGLYLLCLLAMALYSAWVPRWSDQLNSFAMMRLGAAMADKVPLLVARDVGKIKVLDETPGWIGDATAGEGEVGELAIGAETRLRGGRRYRCYKGDHERIGGVRGQVELRPLEPYGQRARVVSHD